MTLIQFGTDGWRGKIAEDFTFDNVRRCAQGFARYLAAHGQSGADVVIGHDRRFASRDFAVAAAEVMAANGYRVWLTDGPTPTPVISFSVVERKAAGAINITASHNPPSDNGFKVRDEHGAAIAPDGLREIEAAIPPIEEVRRTDFAAAQAEGRIIVWDPAPAYIAHLSRLVDMERIRQAGLHILVEPMWGNGIGWFPRLLAGGRTRVTEIHNVPNPLFPEMVRPEPIPPNVDVALAKTTELGADVCVILDGDADRMGIGDEHGRFINQLQVYALLAYYLLEVRGERGAMVKTLSTTSMLEKLGEIYGVPVYQVGVGFKYVAPKMLETDAMIGGEESGGYAFRGHVPERDGILGNLYFLDMMVRKGKTPSQLLDELYGKLGAVYSYSRLDITFPAQRREEIRARLDAARPESILGLRVTDILTYDGYKYYLEDGGWLLLRFSGTEPLIRIYCETTDAARVHLLLEEGRKLAGV
ncbi:MAG: phosphoglucomutase/phosphomannomutase family protein [Anaerolineae bacterium]|nr:phosphoglucomutase/phosphomannomutase family protein [Anaerolineae bacterium]MDW8067492.1 phosphoglucomutase/phosphomannomutase family protein [Anaerolineae bacterium]